MPDGGALAAPTAALAPSTIGGIGSAKANTPGRKALAAPALVTPRKGRTTFVERDAVPYLVDPALDLTNGVTGAMTATK